MRGKLRGRDWEGRRERGRSERQRSGGRQGRGGERGKEVLQGGVRRREREGGGEVGIQRSE